MKVEYPKFLYHVEKGAVLVKSKEEHEALGDGHVESPASLCEVAKEVKAEPVSMPKEKSRKPRA